MSRYQFIEQVATTEPVQVLCRVLAVSTAGYYQWRRRADRHLPGSRRPPPPFRAMPNARALAACGHHYTPKGTRSGATPCALGYAAAACGR